MTDGKNPADPGDEIRRIQEEYEKRECLDNEFNHLPKDSLVGSIWLNPQTDEMFVCNGRINGEAVWTKVDSTKTWV